jgi:predicted dinucleotide-binding enzyme
VPFASVAGILRTHADRFRKGAVVVDVTLPLTAATAAARHVERIAGL